MRWLDLLGRRRGKSCVCVRGLAKLLCETAVMIGEVTMKFSIWTIVLTSLIGLPLITFRTTESAQALPNDVAPAVQHFSVGKGGRLLIVPVDLDGRRVPFMLDTGAAKTVIDASLVSELGPTIGTVNLNTSAGLAEMATFACPAAKVGSFDLQVIGELVCCDLRRMRYASGMEFYGILGMDFLRHYAVEIDFDQGIVSLWAQAPATWRNSDCPLPMAFAEGQPHLVAKVSGCEVSFVVDTGANKSHISHEVFDRLVAAQKLFPAGISSGQTLGGGIQSTIGYVQCLQLGFFEHTMIRLDRDEASGLGLQYLSRYRLRFDFPRSEMHLCPSEQFSRQERTASSGMALAQINGHKAVLTVKTGGAAMAAGIRESDELIAVENRSASEIDMHELMQMLTSEPGKEISMLVARDARQIPITLRLRNRIPESAHFAR